MMWGYVPNGGIWLMMMVGNLFWIALLGLLAWAIISWSGSRAHRPMPQKAETLGYAPSALEILRQRYARGEIDALTFEQMRERLESASVAEEKPAYELPRSISSR